MTYFLNKCVSTYNPRSLFFSLDPSTVTSPQFPKHLYFPSHPFQMWPPWLTSPNRFGTTSPPSPPPSYSHTRSSTFSCSSFKDIQSLITDKPEHEPSSPNSSSIFRRMRTSTSVLRAWATRPSLLSSDSVKLPPGLDQGVVVYYTSLRVVRRTFDDCRTVRTILRGFRVIVDERDVSIDDRFRDELDGIFGRRNVKLPTVFIGGAYIGGAEEVQRLYNSGELERMIERLPMTNQNGCDFCGGFRFIVCNECNGSHKVFKEKNGFMICSSCNTNGLIRCPQCFFMIPRYTK
ncbi:putative thioredoxin-like protein [Lupinus albus]|uniref:Putative thioredoxin-like protein n=1 Tax=Lupinus albus TaxID=3870 RepID=A0A6A4QMV8_LUPAL|nr:putative thioredoxin-like protein [Lupinus albus]